MKGNLKGLLLAAAAGAMMMATVAMAQAPAGGPPGAGPGAGGPRGGGFGGPVDRATVVQRFGLADATLNLTAAQKAELEKAADVYVTESNAITATPGGPPSPEVQAARTKARDNLTAAVHKVLNADQRKTWDAAQAAQAGRRGGGMGGPGGAGGPGAGGPPGGARPPGQ